MTPSGARPVVARVRWLYLRALGLVFACAFASLWPQLAGLLGPEGLEPAAELLASAREVLPAPGRYLQLPTLLWAVGAGEGALHAVALGGLLFSALLVFDVAPRWSLLGAWACYLSLVNVGSVFLGFQWDVFLLEVALVSLPLAPGHLCPPRVAPAMDPVLLLPPRLLLFRLMLVSGALKLASGDATWRELTALDYHLWTQPLPNPLAWFAHQLPGGLRQAGAGMLLVIELLAPFLLFGPRPLRLAAAAALAALHGAILVSGNHAFFNLLGLVLCLAALDDGVLARWRRAAPPPAAPEPPRRFPRLRTAAFGTFAVGYALLGLSLDMSRLSGAPLLPPVASLLEALAGFNSLHSYAPYAVMTTRRQEVVLEGSGDGHAWHEYRLPWRPGRVDEAPHFVAPHQPRLDWQLWFASLSSCEDNPWLLRFQQRLLEGAPAVRGLLEEDPFPDEPPRFVRTRLYDYRFTDMATLRTTGAWWRREESGPYCPPFTLEAGRLQAVR